MKTIHLLELLFSNFSCRSVNLMIILSIGSTETNYIKLNTKTQNIFYCVNENLTTFLYTLTGGTRKQMEKKVSFLKCIQKSNVILKNWVLVFSFM